jgi:hypothetical protein
MDKGLLHLHSLMRWVILILLLLALFQALTKNSGIRKGSLWLMIAAHITLLIGLYQWFTGPLGLKILQNNSMKEVMGNSALRFWAVEHITCMLLAILLITVARGKAKMLNYKAVTLLYLLALLLILAGVPWPFREAVARPWFPGM